MYEKKLAVSKVAAVKAKLKAEQTEFLRQRDQCASDIDCVENQYEIRGKQLK